MKFATVEALEAAAANALRESLAMPIPRFAEPTRTDGPWYSWFGDYVECGDCHAAHVDGPCAATDEPNPLRPCACCGKAPTAA